MNILLAAFMLAMSSSPKAEVNQDAGIRTMPVSRTPEGDAIVLRIAIPKDGAILQNPVWLQFRIDGFSLGSDSSQFERSTELAQTDMGQTVHVVVDNEPYFPVNEPAIDPFNESGYYYDTSYKLELPYRLGSGMHTLRIFPARAYGESLKGDNTFYAIQFFIGEEKYNSSMDLSKPYLTYNEPSDELYLVEGKPVLLDFIIKNAELSSDGFKVRVTIDGKVNRTITSWQPYYIYGLKAGKHKVKLELLDPSNVVVPGDFNTVTRSFTVH